MEYFAHPWFMAAGGALVSSPILIHLINRMRFKRIRWAAMEFLLKSQKRNRRRLIIEQMILLLLRILLVLLAAFLVARFLYGGVGPRGANHVVIVDDTLSMLDAAKEGAGPDTNAYNAAIDQIKEVARNAAQAPSAQNMRIFLLSELDKSPLFEGRLSDQSVEDIDAKFAARSCKPTLPPLARLSTRRAAKARKFLSEIKSDVGNKVLHFVSDFRDSDWTGADSDKLTDEVKGILQDGVNLNLIDVAAPYRGTTGKVALNHDNIALVDLKADTRVAIEDADVEFTASIVNFGQGEARTFLKVYVNGENDLNSDFDARKARRPAARPSTSSPCASLPRTSAAWRSPRRTPPRSANASAGWNASSSTSASPSAPQKGAEDAGLNADNVRDMVIEVRRHVPTLLVDGNKPEYRGNGGDLFHMLSFYAGSGIYEAEERRLADLEKADLDLYPSIILLNVGEIPAAVIAKLKTYVENGGSLCYFMGEEVKSDHYNTALFKAGIFPLQIEDRPYDPLNAAGIVDPEARKKERERLHQTDPQPKILFRDPEKNILAQRLSPVALLFRYLSINVYWKAMPRSRWDPDGRKTDTPIVLPNASRMDSYKQRAQELASNALRNTTERLAGREPEMKRFIPSLEKHSRARIRNALIAGRSCSASAEVLQDLLTDPGVKDDPEKPRMSDLWSHAEMKGLAAEIKEFRNDVLYGDPLVVSKAQGKGRVVAILTPAGTIARRGVGEDAGQWNNWGAGDPVVSATYPLFLLDLHRYLISEGQAPNRLLGEEVRYQLDATRYDPKFTWTFEPQPDMSGENMKAEPEKEKGVMEKAGNLLNFSLTNVRKPGVYKVTHTFLGDGAEETRAYAYNIDAVAESDLKRAAEDRAEAGNAGPATANAASSRWSPPAAAYEEFKEKQPDASESPWLYLFFIIILVVEQAMAVHLSFHMKGNESGRLAR